MKKHKHTEDKASTHKKPDHLNRLQMYSSFPLIEINFILQ